MSVTNQSPAIDKQCGHCFGQKGQHYKHCSVLYWKRRGDAIQKARVRAAESNDVNRLEANMGKKRMREAGEGFDF